MSYTDYDFPHTHMYDSDLREILAQMQKLKEIVNTFVVTNTVELADPIQWNIASQYTKNKIVLDNVGNAYLSKQPIPAGIELDNEDYWLEIFNYTQYVKSFNSNLTYNIEENTTRASKDYEVGDWLVLDDLLYKVIVDIEEDELFIIDTNIERFTVEEFCRAWVDYTDTLIQQYKNDIDASELQYKNDIDASELAFTTNLQNLFNQAVAGVTVDSEILLARVGWNGYTYSTLANAIQTQIKQLMYFLGIDYYYSSETSYTTGVGFITDDSNIVSIPSGKKVRVILDSEPGTISTIAVKFNTTEVLLDNLSSGHLETVVTTSEVVTSIRYNSGNPYILGNGTVKFKIISDTELYDEVLDSIDNIYGFLNRYKMDLLLDSSFAYTAGVNPNKNLAVNIPAGTCFLMNMTADASTITNVIVYIGTIYNVFDISSGKLSIACKADTNINNINISAYTAGVLNNGTFTVEILEMPEHYFESYTKSNANVMKYGYPLKAINIEETAKKLEIIDPNYSGLSDAIIFADDKFVDGAISFSTYGTPAQTAVAYSGIIFGVSDEYNYRLFAVNWYAQTINVYEVVNGVITTVIHTNYTRFRQDYNELVLEKIGNRYRFIANGALIHSLVDDTAYTYKWGWLQHINKSDFTFYYPNKTDYDYKNVKMPLIKVAGFGDSIMYGSLAYPVQDYAWFYVLAAKIQALYPTAVFDNYGVGGYTIQQTLENEIDAHLSEGYTTCFIMAGTNDTRTDRRTDFDDIYTYMLKAVRTCKAAGITPILFTLLAITGTDSYYDSESADRATVISSIIRKIAEDEHVLLIDNELLFSLLPASVYASDGIHPNNSGHAAIANEVFNKLLNIIDI